jgi:hypothetical protein
VRIFAELTPHAAIMRANGRGLCHWRELRVSDRVLPLYFDADGQEMCAIALSTAALSEIVDDVLQLLAASVVHSIILKPWIPLAGTSINAASLAYLMEQCQSLKAVTLQKLNMDASVLSSWSVIRIQDSG